MWHSPVLVQNGVEHGQHRGVGGGEPGKSQTSSHRFFLGPHVAGLDKKTLQCVLSGHIDGKSRFRDFTTGRVVSKFKEHRDAVTSISSHPVRGFCVATGCHDGFVRRFNLRTAPSGTHALLMQTTCPVKPRSARSICLWQ